MRQPTIPLIDLRRFGWRFGVLPVLAFVLGVMGTLVYSDLRDSSDVDLQTVVRIALFLVDLVLLQIVGRSVWRQAYEARAALESMTEDLTRLQSLELRRILDNIPTPIGATSLEPNARTLFLNERFIQTFGYTLSDIPTLDDWARLAYPDAEERAAGLAWWRAAVSEAVRLQGRVESREFRVQGKDGALHNVLISATVLDDRLLCSLVDITELRAMKSRLHASEERLRLIADNALDNLWTMNPEYRLTYISPSIRVLVGYEPEQYLQLSLDLQLAPDSLGVATEYFARVSDDIAAGRPIAPFRGDIELLDRQGAGVWTEIIVIPLLDESGAVLEFLGVTRDIRERKRQDAELRQARLAAESANVAKGQFLAHMSHEIRTPLNGVLGLAQILAREPLAPDQRAMVERIREAGQSLLAILNDVLDLSKIEAGKLRIEARPFDPSELLARIETLMVHVARSKGIELRLPRPREPLGTLLGDDQRLQQILLNLVGNAIKFTDCGRVELRVETLAADAEAMRLRFEVRDTGIGIAPEAVAGIFDSFVQADAGIARRFGGTGLGLSICKRLVEQMGGEIGVTSQPGQGSCFWFELSFARSAVQAPEVMPESASPATRGRRLAGLHLLVVDDSAMNRDVAERMLRLEGAHATPAADGRQALDRLLEQPDAFDAVLMDVQMPVLDGLSATRALRAQGVTELPIIAVTAGVLQEEQYRARAAGVDDILPKPIELEQLVSVLRRWVRPGAEVASDAVLTGLGETVSSRLTDPGVAAAWPVIAGIDSRRLALLAGDDPGCLNRLLRGFVDDATRELQQIRRDLERQAFESASEHLHRLRGAAANLGAVNLSRSAQRLEAAIHEG